MKSLIVFFFVILFSQNSFAQQEALVWSDEFNGIGAPDPAKWSYDLGSNGWGNNEIQNYTNSYQNARQENGFLIIDALKSGNSWTSARLLTNNKLEIKYGRVVFRAKLPVGSGTWPALWMLGENFATKGWPACGEIDVMEHVGKDPGWVQCALHTPSSYGGGMVNFKKKFVSTANSEFHTYQVNWTYEKIEFSIDSVLYYTYKPTVRNLSTWPFDLPFFLIMNIAMGGNMGSDPQYETGGLKNGVDPALTSARMMIDYVRVYQYPIGIDDPDVEEINPNFEKSLFFPNPTYGKIIIKATSCQPGKGTIYNLLGSEVFHFQINNNCPDIDISVLPKGIYFLSVKSDGETKTQKLILK